MTFTSLFQYLHITLTHLQLKVTYLKNTGGGIKMFSFLKRDRYLFLFLLGAFVVPVGDLLHVLTQTTQYPAEQLRLNIFGLPFWVPLLFGTGGVMAGLGNQFIRITFPCKKKINGFVTVAACLVFVAFYCSSGIFPKTTMSTILMGLIAFIIYLLLSDRSTGALLFTIGVMISGTAVESLLVSHGVFSYLPPQNSLYGVAPWLPFLYTGVAVAVDNYMNWSS